MISPRFAVMKQAGALKHGVVHCYYSHDKEMMFGPGFVIEKATNLACHVDADLEIYFFNERKDAVQFLMNTRMNNDEWNWEALASPTSNPLPEGAWA